MTSFDSSIAKWLDPPHSNMLVLFWSFFLLFVSSADVPARRSKRGPKNGDTPSTQDSVDSYLRGVCAESDTWSTPTRPCEIMLTIDYQCLTGLDSDNDVDIMNRVDPG